MLKFEVMVENHIEFWLTLDGRKVAIQDMSKSHIQNTISMLVRNGQRNHHSMGFLWRELLNRDGNYDTASPEQFTQKLELMINVHNRKAKTTDKSSTSNMIRGT